MSQAFRQPPRQIGFKPNAARLVNQAPQRPASEIQQVTQAVQQAQQRQKQLKAQLAQTQNPQQRQQLEKQLLGLQRQSQPLLERLMLLRSEARCTALQALAAPEAGLAADEMAGLLKVALAEFEALYRVQYPLLASQLPPLEQALRFLQQLQQKLQQAVNLENFLGQVQQALEAFYRRQPPAEGQALAQWWQSWQQVLEQQPEGAYLPPAGRFGRAQAGRHPGLSRFQLTAEPQPDLDYDEPELSIDHLPSLAPRHEPKAEQINFEPVASALPAPPRPSADGKYQHLLDQGFTAIDRAIASQFRDRELLNQAVNDLLDAVNLDKTRYEAYFGLGYLFSLVQDREHALYFLKLAYRISGSPRIEQLLRQLHA